MARRRATQYRLKRSPPGGNQSTERKHSSTCWDRSRRKNGATSSPGTKRAGVPTKDVVRAMYERRVPMVLVADGTLAIPATALDGFTP